MGGINIQTGIGTLTKDGEGTMGILEQLGHRGKGQTGIYFKGVLDSWKD